MNISVTPEALDLLAEETRNQRRAELAAIEEGLCAERRKIIMARRIINTWRMPPSRAARHATLTHLPLDLSTLQTLRLPVMILPVRQEHVSGPAYTVSLNYQPVDDDAARQIRDFSAVLRRLHDNIRELFPSAHTDLLAAAPAYMHESGKVPATSWSSGGTGATECQSPAAQHETDLRRQERKQTRNTLIPVLSHHLGPATPPPMSRPVTAADFGIVEEPQPRRRGRYVKR